MAKLTGPSMGVKHDHKIQNQQMPKMGIVLIVHNLILVKKVYSTTAQSW